MGLKCVWFMDRIVEILRLKSDQNGIEIPWWNQADLPGSCVKIRPKWDWNWSIALCHFSPLLVKIRPKWDWNNPSWCFSSTCRIVKIRPKWDWNDLWRTSFSAPGPWLKSDQNGIEMRSHHGSLPWRNLVKIRPKWDWNASGSRAVNSTMG